MPRNIVTHLLLVLDVAIAIAVCANARVATLDRPLRVALAGSIVVAVLAVVTGHEASEITFGVWNGLILCGGAWAVESRARRRLRNRADIGPDARARAGSFVPNLGWFCGGAIVGAIFGAGLYAVLLVVGMMFGKHAA